MINLPNFDDDNKPLNLVKGKWVLIQFIPNPSTSEVFNIGVLFQASRKPYIYKILHNAKNFEIMYGKEAANNFSFLLLILNEYLSKNQNKKFIDLNLPSTQVKFSRIKSAQGLSTELILSSLYTNLIPLSWSDKKLQDEESEKEPTFGTTKLRERIYRQIEKINPAYIDTVYRKEPIYLDIEDKKFSLDLPIFNIQQRLFNNHQVTFGSVVSMRQRSKIRRDYDLFKANKDLIIAKSIYKQKSEGFLFLLNSGFSLVEEEAENIDNEIDESIWLLKKNGITAESFNTPREISHKILQLAA